MRITVIGCGHLGAVHAACMAELGHDVLGVEIDQDKVSILNSGKAWFHEPGLDEMLARNVEAGKVRFTTSFAEAAEFASVHFLGVATPGQPDGSYDLTQVNAAVSSLARHAFQPCLIVGKSTVPPGTAESLAALATDLSPSGQVDVAWNPEFLREGCAIQDTLLPDRIVIGCAGGRAEEVLREIYRPLTDSGTPLVVTDLATAELVKCAANSFLAAKISFINAIADICFEVGADICSLADALGMDPRIGRSFLNAGIGYGGACLPKDVRGLAAFAKQAGTHTASDLLTLVDSINTWRRDRVVQVVRQVAVDMPTRGRATLNRPLTGKRIAVWGGAFKPGTDDVRDSPGLDIARRLHLAGAEVKVYDPMANGNAFIVSPELSYANSAVDAVSDAEMLVIVTPWPEFAAMNPMALARYVANMTVVDACRGIDLLKWQEAGWRVRSLTEGHTESAGESAAMAAGA
jgi:UDPglucose 6-dehydrogenase